MTKLSIFFILFTSTLTFAQKGSPDSITVFSSFYNNQSVIVQGGIFPDSYGYNDLYPSGQVHLFFFKDCLFFLFCFSDYKMLR